MQHSLVPNSNVIADMKFTFFVSNMKHRQILNISSGANTNKIDIASDNYIVPNRTMLTDNYIAENYSTLAVEYCWMELRHNTIESNNF